MGSRRLCNSALTKIGLRYCGFGNFGKNFIFPNSIKMHVCDAQLSQQMIYFHISVNDRVILLFDERFILAKLRIYEVSQK